MKDMWNMVLNVQSVEKNLFGGLKSALEAQVATGLNSQPHKSPEEAVFSAFYDLLYMIKEYNESDFSERSQTDYRDDISKLWALLFEAFVRYTGVVEGEIGWGLDVLVDTYVNFLIEASFSE